MNVCHPEAIELGDEVVMLEGGHLIAAGAGSISIGSGTRLARFVSIHAVQQVTIEEEVSTSDCVAVVDSFAGSRSGWDSIAAPGARPVRICHGAYLGANSVVGPGVTVGAGAFVGEGSTVLHDVPPHSVVYGSPAEVIRRHDADTGEWKGQRHP